MISSALNYAVYSHADSQSMLQELYLHLYPRSTLECDLTYLRCLHTPFVTPGEILLGALSSHAVSLGLIG